MGGVRGVRKGENREKERGMGGVRGVRKGENREKEEEGEG